MANTLEPLSGSSVVVVHRAGADLVDKTPMQNYQGVTVNEILALGGDEDNFVSNVALNGTDLEFTSSGGGAFSGQVDLSSLTPTDGLLVGTQYEFVSGNSDIRGNGIEFLAKYTAAANKVQEESVVAGNISVIGYTFTNWFEPITIAVGGDPEVFLKHGANKAYPMEFDVAGNLEKINIYVTDINTGTNEITFILLDEREPGYTLASVNFVTRYEKIITPATLLVAPGIYEIGEATFDAAVNIVAIDGETSVTILGIPIFSHAIKADYTITIAGLKFPTENEFLLTPGTNIGYIFKNIYSYNRAFISPGRILGGEYINCTTVGNNSFGYDQYDVIAEFKDCTAGSESFCVGSTNASPLVDGCKSTGNNSFGWGVQNLEGVFKNCGSVDATTQIADNNDSFGNLIVNSSAHFINCYGNNSVFGIEVENNTSTYKDCTATGYNSFGNANINANFNAYNCIAMGDDSFGVRPNQISRDGNIVGCLAFGARAFGWENGSGAPSQNYQGKIYNCVAKGSDAFNAGANIDAKIIGCIAEQNAISSVNTGIVRNCVDTNFNVVNIP